MCALIATVSVSSFAEGGNGGRRGGKHRIRVTPDMELDRVATLTAESNIYQGTVYINSFFEYVTKNRWDLGLYAFNMPVYGGGAQNFQYDTYVSLSKWFEVSPQWSIGLGAQNGTTLVDAPRNFHHFSFIQNAVKVNDYLAFNVGMFYVNRSLATINQPIGAMVGIDWQFIPHVAWAEFDFLSGNSNLAGSVVNLFWRPVPSFDVYAGIQVPATSSGNEFAGNVGVVMALQ